MIATTRSLAATVDEASNAGCVSRWYPTPILTEPFTNTARYDGITDASHLILTDGTTVHAIDAGDGSTAWSMPLPPSGKPSFRTTVKAMGGRMITLTAHEFTGYAAA